MSEPSQPSENGANGRGRDGKFTRGNPGGPGNPYARRAAALRRALYTAVTTTDLRAIVRRLVTTAVAGDVQAAKLILERLLGPPVAADFEERLATLEERLLDQGGSDGSKP